MKRFPVTIDGEPRYVTLEEARALPREVRGYVPGPAPAPVLRFELEQDGAVQLIAATQESAIVLAGLRGATVRRAADVEGGARGQPLEVAEGRARG